MKSRFVFLIFMFIKGFPLLAVELFSRTPTISEIEGHLAKMSDDETSRSKAGLLLKLGQLYNKEQRYSDAAAVLEKTLLQPSGQQMRIHVFRNLAKSYEGLGQLDKTIYALENAVMLDPKNWKRWRDVAGGYQRAQLFNKALQAYEKAIHHNLKNAQLHFDAAQVLRSLRLYESASEHLWMAHRLKKRGPEWEREMSFILEGQGRYAESLSYFRRTFGVVAPVSDIARTIYLALMAGNIDVARKWIDNLRSSADGKECVAFYEEVLKSFTDSPTRVLESQFNHPTLKALVQQP